MRFGVKIIFAAAAYSEKRHSKAVTCEIQALALGFIIYPTRSLLSCSRRLAWRVHRLHNQQLSSLVSPRILKKLTANLRKQLLECRRDCVKISFRSSAAKAAANSNF